MLNKQDVYVSRHPSSSRKKPPTSSYYAACSAPAARDLRGFNFFAMRRPSP
jgi:hypothetical protein